GERGFAGGGLARDVGVPRTVDHDAHSFFVAAAADVAAVDERCAGGVDLGYEGIIAAVVGQVRPDGHGESGFAGIGLSRDIGVARTVHRDAEAIIVAAAA